MRASRFFISTLKEAPSDAEVISHKLMIRAGMIKRLSSGIYNYMPMGLRIINKVANIIRDEMNRAGAIELMMPIVQPAELWQETDRWNKMGPELLRFKDRHGRDYVFQPTSEEVITDIVRNEVKSYRQLPLNFFHIQTKFRDERRPRFGLMRGREFLMKDAYSFDLDEKGLEKSYSLMKDTYIKIFSRLGLNYRVVIADNGSIGGSASEEFHVVAQTGEDQIAFCKKSNFAANVETTEAVSDESVRSQPKYLLAKVSTPGKITCKGVCSFLKLPLQSSVKSIVIRVQLSNDDYEIWLLLLRGDHELNELKVSKLPNLKSFRFASQKEIKENFGSEPGYIGPIGIVKKIKVIADRTVEKMSDFVCGANEIGYHFTGVNWVRDLKDPFVADIRNVQDGDISPDRKGNLEIQRGIEVGHIFQLGTKYSEEMRATFTDYSGEEKKMQMGCYGIGITRILGASIEQNSDEKGIIWPKNISPFELVLCPIGYSKNTDVKDFANKIYSLFLNDGVDVILDDRDERYGVMMSEWELIGIPHRILIGEKSLKKGLVEYSGRKNQKIIPVNESEIVAFFHSICF